MRQRAFPAWDPVPGLALTLAIRDRADSLLRAGLDAERPAGTWAEFLPDCETNAGRTGARCFAQGNKEGIGVTAGTMKG